MSDPKIISVSSKLILIFMRAGMEVERYELSIRRELRSYLTFFKDFLQLNKSKWWS